MIKIEIEHIDIQHCRLSLDEMVIEPAQNQEWHIENQDLPGTIEIFFEPFGIKPKLRIQGFLLNPWFLNAEIYDHMIKFVLHPDWTERIHKIDILERERSLGDDLDDITKDLKIGRSLHADLVADLKKLLYEKSTTL